MQNNFKKHSAKSLKEEILDKTGLSKYYDNLEGFCLSRFEEIVPHVQFPIHPTKLYGTSIALITEGKLCITLEDENYYVKPNQLAIIQSGKIFSIDVINPLTKGYTCYFETDLIMGGINDSLLIHKFEFLNLWSPSFFDLNSDKVSFLIHLYKRLYFEYQKNPPNSIIVSNYIISLLLEIDIIQEKNIIQRNKFAYFITQSFKKNVYTNINENFTIKKHAELLAITPNHLNKCVKKTTGESASYFINNLKLTEAKYYLTQTILPIANVALKIGYSDHSYFSRFFKKYMGLSPKEYRENNSA